MVSSISDKLVEAVRARLIWLDILMDPRTDRGVNGTDQIIQLVSDLDANLDLCRLIHVSRGIRWIQIDSAGAHCAHGLVLDLLGQFPVGTRVDRHFVRANKMPVFYTKHSSDTLGPCFVCQHQ